MVGAHEQAKILTLPWIRAIFEGAVETVLYDPGATITLIVYLSSDCSDSPEEKTTLGLLDHARDLYYEVSFRGETVIDCRKYTPDYFSHGTALERFKKDYLDVLTDRLPPDMKRKLFGLFLPEEQGLDRDAGGCFITWVDGEGRYREKLIEIVNRYL